MYNAYNAAGSPVSANPIRRKPGFREDLSTRQPKPLRRYKRVAREYGQEKGVKFAAKVEKGAVVVRMLSLPPIARFADFGPFILRVIAGIIMLAHGLQKLIEFGPANFGGVLADLGVPLPVFMGYVVTFAELIGGTLLIVGLLSRLAALMLAIEMVFTTLLVKANLGLIASNSRIPGAELDLALMAGFIAILLLGPGKIALDYLLGIERPLTRQSVSR